MEISQVGVKRIAIVVPEYRSEKSGGGVSAVADFLVNVFDSEEAWETEIVSLRMWRGAPQSRRLFSVESWRQGPTVTSRLHDGKVVLEVGSDWAEFEFMRFFPRRVLTETLKEYDLAVVVSGTPAALFAVKDAPIPVVSQVATFVDVEREQLISRSKFPKRLYVRVMTALSMLLDKRGIRVPMTMLVENEWMLQRVVGLGAQDARLCAPGVDTEQFRPSPESSKEDYILMVGRLDDPRKDLPTLLRAYALARQTHGVGQRLILAGRFPPVPEDRALIRELQIEEFVEVRSPVSPEELVNLYQQADLFVLPSTEEGLGVVLIEAMACGLPILSTSTEGAKHIFGKAEVGEMIDFGDGLVSRLAASLGRWANDAELRSRIGQLARARAIDHFSQTTAGGRFCDAVRDALV